MSLSATARWSEPPTPQVSGILVRALADTVTRYGVAPERLLEVVPSSRRTQRSFPVEQRVPLAVLGLLFERAAVLTVEPAIGLVCGFEATECAFDLLAPLVSHVSSLRDAIRETRQFQSLAFEGAHIHLTEHSGVARLRCEFPRSEEQTDRSVAEFMVGSLLRMLRLFGGTRADLRAACFEFRRPGSAHAHQRICQGVESYAQPFTGLEFSASLLDRPHLHANPELQTAAHAQAEQRLSRLMRPTSLLERLRELLRNQPAPHVPSMEQAADALGISSRSLRRRLTEQNISYRALIQGLQEERACALLRNPAFTIQHVAGMVGFTDTGAFHRAFKRWTGMSPSAYRER